MISFLKRGFKVLLFAAFFAAYAMPTHAVDVPAPAADAPLTSSSDSQTLVLAGGCFWGMQAVFEHVKGVDKVTAGYAGGSPDTANYETVSTGSTGHAESVEII